MLKKVIFAVLPTLILMGTVLGIPNKDIKQSGKKTKLKNELQSKKEFAPERPKSPDFELYVLCNGKEIRLSKNNNKENNNQPFYW